MPSSSTAKLDSLVSVRGLTGVTSANAGAARDSAIAPAKAVVRTFLIFMMYLSLF